MSEVKARKQGRESDNLCSAYLNGFIDGANNPKGCEIKDLTFFMGRFVSYSKTQNDGYFNIVVKSFVAKGCQTR